MSDNPHSLINLKELFLEKKELLIPTYQRGYSWDTQVDAKRNNVSSRQVNDLFEDVKKLVEGKDGNAHYTGAIYLQSKGEGKTYIVDGQQRLLTLSLFLSRIYAHLENKESSPFFRPEGVPVIRYESQDSNHATAYLNIMGITSLKFPDSIRAEENGKRLFPESFYTIKLYEAAKFFDDTVEPFSQETLEKYYKALFSRLYFSIIDISSFKAKDAEQEYNFDVNLVFEGINNRGKPLSTLELLKNRLVYLVTSFKNEDRAKNLRAQIDKTFSNVYRNLGRTDNALDGDALLLNLERILGKCAVSRNDLSKKLFKDLYAPGKKDEEYKLGEDLENLSKASDYWGDIFDPVRSSLLNDEEKKAMESCNAAIGSHNSLRGLLLASMFHKQKHPEENLANFLFEVTRYSFLTFNFFLSREDEDRVNGVSFDTFVYNNLAKSIFKEEMSLEKAIETIKERTKKREGKIESAIKTFKTLFEEKSSFYSWTGTSFLLAEYAINRHKAPLNEIIAYRKMATSLEHILPQTYFPVMDWFRLYPYSNMNDCKKYVVGALGNLLLVSPSLNTRASNKTFVQKADIYRKDENKSAYGKLYEEQKKDRGGQGQGQGLEERRHRQKGQGYLQIP